MIVRKALVFSGLALFAFISLAGIYPSSKAVASPSQIVDGTDPMPNPYPKPPKSAPASTFELA